MEGFLDASCLLSVLCPRVRHPRPSSQLSSLCSVLCVLPPALVLLLCAQSPGLLARPGCSSAPSSVRLKAALLPPPDRVPPAAKKYTEDHEAVIYDDATNTGTVTITNYAQSSLGDVVFVELPTVGTEVEQGGEFAPRLFGPGHGS